MCNRNIFQVPGSDDIFQSSGACHKINTDQLYQKNKIIKSGHYSAYNYPYSNNTEKIIFIEHNPKFDFILLTNTYYRCHPDALRVKDFNVEDINKLHIDFILNDNPPVDLKNNWYNKLIERHFDLCYKKKDADLPTYNFDYTTFFNLGEFLLELRKVSNFLNRTFVFDQSIVELWRKFIDLNQGYYFYNRANYLFDQIVQNKSNIIENDWKIHAYLNYKISTIFHLYDEPKLFQNNAYPATTNETYNLIISHIKSFDTRF